MKKRLLTARQSVGGGVYAGFLRVFAGLGSREDHLSHNRILVYHRVNSLGASFQAVSVAKFERQIRFLVNNYNVVSLTELVCSLRTGAAPSANSAVAITFDDGCSDNFTDAFPILRKYSVPATVFPIVNNVETGSQFLVDRTLVLEGGYPLTWQEIKRMAEHNIEFGAHTLTHRVLAFLDREDATHEIVASKRLIEERTGLTVRHFAYPGGSFLDFGQREIQLVRAAGFVSASSAIPGPNGPCTNPFALRRMEVTEWDTDETMRARLSGDLDCLRWLQSARLKQIKRMLDRLFLGYSLGPIGSHECV